MNYIVNILDYITNFNQLFFIYIFKLISNIGFDNNNPQPESDELNRSSTPIHRVKKPCYAVNAFIKEDENPGKRSE